MAEIETAELNTPAASPVPVVRKNSRRVLLVSAYPFSRSSRGMDVFTGAFEAELWDTTHLTFPRVFYTPDISGPSDTRVKSLISRKALLPYVDRFMWWLPRFAFELIRRHNVRTVEGLVDFSSYDVIVLESGKPLFLLPEIPDSLKVIYRQSDSVRLALGRGRCYIELEDDAFLRASKVILKKSLYKDFIPAEHREKALTVENGMALPARISGQNPFPSGTLNAVYVGLHALDEPTLSALLREYGNVDFHIIGPCLSGAALRRLSEKENFHHYAFLSKEEYMPLLKFADLAIFPFVRKESMKWFGLTSKFLHFMYFQLPIVSYPTGLPGEFEGLSVQFAKNQAEFLRLVGENLNQKPVTYTVDFDYYSPGARMDEYRDVVRSLVE